MSNKEDVLKDERRLQRACEKYIHHEGVIYCVSSLIYELREVAEKLDDYDTYLALTGGVPDYEEAARYFIEFDADLDQLEEISEEWDSWSNVFEHACAKATSLLVPVTINYVGGDEKIVWGVSEEAVRAQYLSDEPAGFSEDVEDASDDVSTNDWCEHNDGLEKHIREAVQDAVNSAPDEANQWVCREYDLEPDYREVYEHWIVSRYLGAELEAQGESVEEYLGLNIWGRTTTGQSISMDGVIREIVSSRSEDHWIWGEV